MEDILKSKTKCSIFVFNNIWRSRYEKMEYDHEENDSFAFAAMLISAMMPEQARAQEQSEQDNTGISEQDVDDNSVSEFATGEEIESSQVDDAVDSENENQTTDVQDGNTEKETKTDPSDDGQNEGEAKRGSQGRWAADGRRTGRHMAGWNTGDHTGPDGFSSFDGQLKRTLW